MSAADQNVLQARSPRPFAKTAAAGLVAILLAFLLLAVTYSIVNPLFEAPDELPHFFTARHLAQGLGFAAPDPSKPWAQEASQPPLYYLLTAAVIAPIDTSDAEDLLWKNEHAATGFPGSLGNKNQVVHTAAEAWPYRGAALAVHLGRLFSILLASLTVVLVYALGRALVPRSPAVALALAALVAFTPQFLFTSASVSNDNLINLAAALAAWLLVRGLRGPRPRGWAVLLGISLGLAGLSKATGLFLWPLAGVAILLVAWRRRAPEGALRQALLDLLVIFALAGLVAGWWYVRSWRLYGDLTGVGSITAIMATRDAPLTLPVLIGELRGLRYSYWGMFGWFNVPSPLIAYKVADALTLLALIGLPFSLVPRLARGGPAVVRRADLPWLLLPAGWLALVALALLRYDLMLPALQGRLLMPAGWAANLFLVLGWAGVVRVAGRWVRGLSAPARRIGGRTLAAAPLVFLSAWAVLAPFALIAPAYATPQLLSQDQVPAAARRDPLDFGPYARLLGAEVQPQVVRPGDVVKTTLYWEAREPFDTDYSVFIQALGPNGLPLAQVDSWPGKGTYPTRLWQPGQVVADVHEFRIPESAEAVAPAVLPLIAGFYRMDTGQRLKWHPAGSAASADSLAAADAPSTAASLGSVQLVPNERAVQP